MECFSQEKRKKKNKKKLETNLMMGPKTDVIPELKQYNILMKLLTCTKMLMFPPGRNSTVKFLF